MSRATIRTAVHGAIVTSGAFATGKVRMGKLDAVAEAEMPCAAVYTGADAIEPITLGNPRRFEHTLTVHVDIYSFVAANVDGGVEAALDALCVAVESAVHADSTLNAVADDCFLSAVDYDLNGESGKQLGCARMEFKAAFRTLET